MMRDRDDNQEIVTLSVDQAVGKAPDLHPSGTEYVRSSLTGMRRDQTDRVLDGRGELIAQPR